MEEEIRRQTVRLSLIDVSSEDDSLFVSSPIRDPDVCKKLNSFGASECASAQDVEKAEKEHVSLEVSEPIRERKASKCNLRKSLAWNSAFFTNEGVLDPEELDLVSKPIKAAVRSLPGILEDTRRSTESNSTLGSDSWALENLEEDLFEDIRASIQKSGHRCDKSSSSASSIIIAAKGEPDAAYIGSSPVVELASQNLTKQGSKLPGISRRQGVIKKKAEKKEEVLCAQKGAIRKTDHNFPSRPPKSISGVAHQSAPSNSRVAAAINSAKVKNNTNILSVAGNILNQRPTTSRNQAGPLYSPKPAVGSTGGAKLRSAISSSPFNSTDSTSSSSTGKSASKNLKNRAILKNADQSSLAPAAKTPLRNLRVKVDSRTSSLSAHVMSASMLSSCVSPASSLDGMSSESCSSICSNSQRTNGSVASFDVISLDSFESEAPQSPDWQNQLHDRPQGDDGSFREGLLNQGAAKALGKMGPLSHTNAAAIPKSSFVGNAGLCMKPSGLRMPSPKLGFFDAEKTAGINISGCSLSRSGMPKNNTSNGILDGALKQKSYKFQPARSQTQAGLLMLSSKNTRTAIHAAVSSNNLTSTQHQTPNPTAELSSTSGINGNCANVCVKEGCGKPEGGQHESDSRKFSFPEDLVRGFDTDMPKVLKEDRKVDFVRSVTNTSSASPTKVEPKADGRSPLSVKCYSGNSKLQQLSESTTEKAIDKSSASPLVEKSVKAFKLDALCEAIVELGQENVAANGFYQN